MGVNLVNVRLVKPRGCKGYRIKDMVHAGIFEAYVNEMASIRKKEVPPTMIATTLFLGSQLSFKELVNLGILKILDEKPPPLNWEIATELKEDFDLGLVRDIACNILSDMMHASDNKHDINLRVEIFLRRLLGRECFQPIHP